MLYYAGLPIFFNGKMTALLMLANRPGGYGTQPPKKTCLLLLAFVLFMPFYFPSLPFCRD